MEKVVRGVGCWKGGEGGGAEEGESRAGRRREWTRELEAGEDMRGREDDDG